MNRPLIFVGFLAACFAIPYAMHHPSVMGLMGPSTRGPGSLEEALTTDLEPAVPLVAKATPVPRATTATPGMLEGPAVADFSEVFRFDVNSGWVASRWGRVSTAAGEYGLKGYRVALVTGTGHDDLAGALTYFFDNRLKVKRITFRGATGDPGRLVAYLTQMHGLERQHDEQAERTRFVRKEGKQVVGSLEIRVASLLEGSRPHDRFEVLISLDRPAGEGDDTLPQADREGRGYSFRPW